MSEGNSEGVFGMIGDVVGELFTLTLSPLTHVEELTEAVIDHGEAVIDSLNPVSHISRD